MLNASETNELITYLRGRFPMKLTTNLELGKYFTFELSKQMPIHNWFYYKEGFAPQVVEWAIKQGVIGSWPVASGQMLIANSQKLLLDPFCGCGTSMLTAKGAGLNAIGFDISPIAVLASQVKCENYDKNEIEGIRKFLDISKLPEANFDWQFELFSPRAVFPRSNYNALLSLRQAIDTVENGKIRNLLLLTLVSIIPQVGIFIKDGGVLRIDKRKHAMPTKEAFRRKLKNMIYDLEKHAVVGEVPEISQGDARAMQVADNSIDIIVTSPPYLNNVDYTKVYGLELSLMFLDKSITKQIRGESVRSFITSNVPPDSVPPEIGDAGIKVPVIGNYFSDLEKTLIEIKRVLKTGSACYLIIGNSVVYGLQIFVDELLAEMAERLGMQTEIIVGAERVADVKPRRVKIRESIVVIRKTGL
ncbi:hypothetical protein J4450_06890 [Candidatus Micrarchaeota archaeon]|nr:hypothetical protein [Candidatus Micrarchaeota archaeon]